MKLYYALWKIYGSLLKTKPVSWHCKLMSRAGFGYLQLDLGSFACLSQTIKKTSSILKSKMPLSGSDCTFVQSDLDNGSLNMPLK